jgi:maltokinase
MMRSFDYAAHAVQRSLAGHDETSAPQRARRAEEWAARNKQHFLTAYAGGDLTPQQGTLLAAYVADKAVYECVYETRNRPAWVSIPLEAVARIGVP